jgi:ribosomal protein S18 acetylase RimI-like enzyme
MANDLVEEQPQIIIRAASSSDAAAIAAVHVASWRETYAGLLPDEMLRALSVADRTERWLRILDQARDPADAVVFVAERNGRVVGFASGAAQRDENLRAQGLTGEITAIYVLQSAQRMGIGRRLMTSVVHALAVGGRRSASLWVLRDNQAARRFYQSLGGNVVAEKEDVRDGAVLAEVAYAWRDLARAVLSPVKTAKGRSD